jgi:TPR repeat protein
LSRIYNKAHGIDQNLDKALFFAKRAADQGDETGLCILGEMFMYGEGTEIDYGEAFKYTSQAAELNVNTAQNTLACMYMRGQGVEMDLRKSFEWLKRAAENGHLIAMTSLAGAYECGMEKFVRSILIRQGCGGRGIKERRMLRRLVIVFE